MKILRNLLDSKHKIFAKGGSLEKLYPIYEMVDTFLFTPGEVTRGSVHVRDGLDLKRGMVTVAMALFPCILFALYNTGYQANLAYEGMNILEIPGWRGSLLSALGVGVNSSSYIGNMLHGLAYFLPIFLVTNIAGGLCEVVFSVVRKHEINEGFLVTGILFPLILPASIPLWQVAMGIMFGVVVGKEVFGGTGKNFLNPALTARAFLFFAYPAQISGELVWTAVDGFSGATALSHAAQGGISQLLSQYSWTEAFIGLIPGSMGETSVIAILLGAALLIITGIGSWRIMLSMTLSAMALAFLLNVIGSDTNPMFSITPLWHLVLGGFAFGTVFMATDPVSASMTLRGHWYYGTLIGCMVILVRVINPAFPEGVMLAILFGNCFAPLIDFFVVEGNIKRRERRNV